MDSEVLEEGDTLFLNNKVGTNLIGMVLQPSTYIPDNLIEIDDVESVEGLFGKCATYGYFVTLELKDENSNTIQVLNSIDYSLGYCCDNEPIYVLSNSENGSFIVDSNLGGTHNSGTIKQSVYGNPPNYLSLCVAPQFIPTIVKNNVQVYIRDASV